MAQTSILAPATTIGDVSSDITIGQGETVTVGLYVASGKIPDNASFDIYQKTPGAAFRLASLKARAPVVIAGAGVYYVQRLNAANLRGSTTPVAVGVYKEQG